MAYIEGTSEVQPGDPVGMELDGERFGVVVKSISRTGIELTDEAGSLILLDLSKTNEAIWDRGRKFLEQRAGSVS